MLQLKHAQLATEHEQSKTQTTSIDDNIDIDLDKYYQISKTQKDGVNIYSYIYANPSDPAFDICFCIPCTYPGASV